MLQESFILLLAFQKLLLVDDFKGFKFHFAGKLLLYGFPGQAAKSKDFQLVFKWLDDCAFYAVGAAAIIDDMDWLVVEVIEDMGRAGRGYMGEEVGRGGGYGNVG